MKNKSGNLYIISLIYLLYMFVVVGNSQNSAVETTATTTFPSPINETKNQPYYICGEEKFPEEEPCRCNNKHISCITYLWQTKSMKNANIQLLNPKFIVESAHFDGHNFGILKKNESLPSVAGNITSLYLTGNKITDIENETFDKFNKLQHLSLSSNNLKNLSAEILTQKLGSTLLELVLNDNQLTFSSIDFTYMTNLRVLQAGFNIDIGKSFASSWIFPKSLSNLTGMYLGHCNITNISENIFVNLVNLQHLILYDNPLTSYPKNLNNIHALRHLDLTYTPITDLNQTSMGINEHLNVLMMQNTKITKIEDCAFCGFTNLTTLYLNNNKNLSFIDENAFGYAKNKIPPKLKSISLEYCNLSIIPEKLLNWHILKEFGVIGNPFNCSCEMAWLIDDITNPTHTMNLKKLTNNYGEPSTTLKCKTPFILKDIEFYKLNQNYCKKSRENSAEDSVFIFGYIVLVGIFVLFLAALFKYLFRLRKQKKLFNNAENKANGDFDESESYANVKH